MNIIKIQPKVLFFLSKCRWHPTYVESMLFLDGKKQINLLMRKREREWANLMGFVFAHIS